jgi:DNA mismatch repair protein MutS2
MYRLNNKIFSTLEFHKILYKLSTHASTSLGKEWTEQLRPSSDLDEVKRRLQATDEAARIERIKGAVPFGGIRDIRPSVKRASKGGTLNAAELLDIANTVSGSTKLKKFIISFHQQQPVLILEHLSSLITEEKKLEESIKSCINDHAEVVDHASPELSRIRQSLRANESRVREKLEQMIRTPSVQKMLQDVLITIRNDRYVIPVKQEYRGNFGGIIHDQSASGATLFIEPEVIVQLNNKLRELKLEEENEIEKILRRLTAQVAEYADSLLETVAAAGQLDFIFTKAGLARELKATFPIMNDRGFLKIRKGRHPLIPADQVVPIDVELGNEYTAIIITGPNTGGKTVSLKTIGLLSLMAMSGLFVPAEDESKLCVFDGIYADIGDEQSIEQNLSTFSSHLTNIIRILREMTPKSLVLLDELGAGTDPAEGSALAIAILEHIHRMGCRMLATTHYSELKAYAFETKGLINASMEFNVQTLSPTYRLMVGVPGRSNAFAIAERLGLPKSIIDSARGQVREDDQRVESMIASLEENRISAESERREAESLRREVDKLRQMYEDQQRRFEEQKAKLIAGAEREAKEMVAKARREADEIIAELRRMALEERASIKEHKLIEAKRRLEEAEPKPQKAAAGHKKTKAKVEPGDEVFVSSFGQKGHVVDKAGNDEVYVQLGIMKMKVHVTDIEPVRASAQKQKQVQANTATIKRPVDEQVRRELDLRGSSLEDSLLEVDRLLDEAVLSNLHQVYIIHGKGTGVLRSGIQEFLRKHKYVKSFRLGSPGEGGAGVTVVEF